MKFRKRIASIALSILMLASMMPSACNVAYADEVVEPQSVEEQSIEIQPDDSHNEESESQTEEVEGILQPEMTTEAESTEPEMEELEQVKANNTDNVEKEIEEAKSYSEEFTITPGEKAHEVTKISYSDYNGDHSVNMYTVIVPMTADSLLVDFGGQKLIAYGYEDASKETYLSSCGNAEGGAYENGGQIGESTAIIRVDNGSFPNYVWVQSPYDSSWNSTDLYVIRIELDGSSDVDDATANAEDVENSAISKIDITDALDKTSKQVKSKMSNSFGDEWIAIGLAREGQIVSSDYYKAVYEEVAKREGNLEDGATSYTNNARAIIGLTAGGFDATNVAGYNLVSKLSDYDAIVAQGINGPIFALIALDSHNYEIPEAREGVTQATRENLVKYILDQSITVFKTNGTSYTGWSYRSTSGEPDVDMTAMAMMALAPYKDDKKVAAAIDGAKRFLKDKYTREEKNSSGKVTKASGTYGNSNSVASAILGLAAVGADPASFIGGNYTSLIDNLKTFLIKNGGFGYTNNTSYNAYATKDGYQALVAIKRMQSGMNSLYDMTDIEKLSILGSNGKAETSDNSSNSDSGNGNNGNTPGKNPVVKPGDKDSDTTNGRDGRKLRFVQGNGGKPLLTADDGADDSSNDSNLSDNSSITSADTEAITDEGTNSASDAIRIMESDGTLYFDPDTDLRKPLMFAGAGFIFLILAILALIAAYRDNQ